MSVLETPRVYFAGQIAWDPITTNNYPANYDEQVTETLFSVEQSVQQFRDQAIDDVLAIGSWNPQGTHRSTFFDTEVNGVDTGGGTSTADPFVGAPVNFMGMLVDCEPYGAFSSQLYFDAINLGVDGSYRIFAPRADRVTARYINFFRYRDKASSIIAGIASVNWQTSFPKGGGLVIDALDSPALQALAKQLPDDDVAGLVIRWNAYRTVYYDDPALGKLDPQPYDDAAKALMKKLKLGGFQPNPARSMLVGAVGLWKVGEPAHEPGGRALIANEFPTGPTNPTVGSAQARLAGNVLTVDLSNSISEAGPDLAKQDLGVLHFVANDGTTIKPLASMTPAQYGRDAYVASSGLVVLDADPDGASFAGTADIELRNDDGSGNYGKIVYLAEQALRAIPTSPNLYINEGDNVTTDVQVYDRGALVGKGVQVSMVGGPSASILNTANTDATGTASLAYQGPQFGAVEGFVLLPGPNPALPASIDPLLTTYMYIRSLPLDADTAALPQTWDNVYTRVLAKWQAMAPCMDNWLDLGSEAQVKAYAPLLQQLTDPANFEDFLFMPVTRDMTQGERTLLWGFLGLGTPPSAVRATVRGVSALEEAAPTDMTRLSQAMRGGSGP